MEGTSGRIPGTLFTGPAILSFEAIATTFTIASAT